LRNKIIEAFKAKIEGDRDSIGVDLVMVHHRSG